MDSYFTIKLYFYQRNSSEQSKAKIVLLKSIFSLQQQNQSNGGFSPTVICKGDHTSRAKGLRGMCALLVYWKLYTFDKTYKRFDQSFRHPAYLKCLNEIRSPFDDNRYEWVSQFFGKGNNELPYAFNDFFNRHKEYIAPRTQGDIVSSKTDQVPPINIHFSEIYFNDVLVKHPKELLEIYCKLQEPDELVLDSIAIKDLNIIVDNCSLSDAANSSAEIDGELFKIVSGGALDLENRFYIERPFETAIKKLLEPGGSTIAVRAPRQFGKTSLFVRMRNWSMMESRLVIPLDFQSLDVSHLSSTKSLFSWLYLALVGETNVLEQDNDLTTNGKLVLTRTIQKRLENAKGRVTLLIDEPDRLFRSDILCSEFFSLLRFWHNQRAFYPRLWGRLDLIFSYTSDPCLWIKDDNQSPFNVAFNLDIEPFSEGNISELIKRHPLRAQACPVDGQAIHKWTAGHPHLTQLLVAAMQQNNSIESTVARALQGEDHIGRCLKARFTPIHNNATLSGAMKTISLGEGCENHFAFETLWSMGLVSGASRRNCNISCPLIAEYFQREFL